MHLVVLLNPHGLCRLHCRRHCTAICDWQDGNGYECDGGGPSLLGTAMTQGGWCWSCFQVPRSPWFWLSPHFVRVHDARRLVRVTRRRDVKHVCRAVRHVRCRERRVHW